MGYLEQFIPGTEVTQHVPCKCKKAKPQTRAMVMTPYVRLYFEAVDAMQTLVDSRVGSPAHGELRKLLAELWRIGP